MKIYCLYLSIIFICINNSSSSDFHNNKDDRSFFSFIKDRIYSQIEEFQENFQHFKLLINSLKLHFYDNYNPEIQEKYKMVKRETQRNRKLEYNIIYKF